MTRKNGRMEYISKQDAIDLLNHEQLRLDCWDDSDRAMGVADARLIIYDMEPEDVAPVIHAKLIYTGYSGNYKCSNCGAVDTREKKNYCDVCGAKLDKEE